MRRKLLEVLDYLEKKEIELIGWGDTEGFFSTEEFLETIERLIPEEDAEEVEDELRASAAVVPVLDGRGLEIGVRTRMAEGMHLFRNLRQWFIGQDLNRSRTLVSDYRFVRNARQYPKRDVEFEGILEEWKESVLSRGITAQFLKRQVGEFSLAGFQVRATKEILSAWEARRHSSTPASATIVCAGTGSGKTLAFYLPALSSLATDLVSDPEYRVRVLAVYPRRELLKDQFNETWRQARLLDAPMHEADARKIRIGALFGETPGSNRYALKPGEEYLNFGLLKCESDSCDGQMRWSIDDVQANVERLVCSSCGHEVCDDEIVLTRASAADRPPDILFTTTEMLNQRMSDSKFRHLFGIGASGKLPLVLLDEVHTYGGVQGAQTGLLMRRWMRLSGSRPHFVGLSATLRDAANFFATLTGASRSRVSLVEPSENELVEEGAEYLLALRGDPVSQTALLSTTTQTAMLMRRILDNPASNISGGVWGSKTFAFTDDLDVNNRLFSALADAEGWQQRQGGLQPNADGPLAQLRNSSTTTASFRDLRAFGQDWAVAKACGFSLAQDDRAQVARTSSQDAGYDADADIIVTTASLEVGFNDPSVGAVIQHKAPRDVSSYLQRKGRAGRQRLMRPWMVVVLSEFGRDRIAYQQYETLIDPQVKLQNLPIDNAHILKMQAAQAALDWFGSRLPKFSVWVCLNNPEKRQADIQRLLALVNGVMSPGPEQDMFQSYIKSALQISDSQLERTLWEAPRSIFLEFLPTLSRRLSSNWARWSTAEARAVEWAELPRNHWHSPVPEFIPESTFAELDVPDLQIRIDRPSGDEWKSMAFFQGLREFAPGRISKRFSVTSGAVSDWLVPRDFQPPTEDAIVSFEVSEAFGPTTSIVAVVPDNDGANIQIHQPHSVLPTTRFADRTVSDTSNAFPRWKSIFVPPENKESEEVPKVGGWFERLKSVTFCTHASMAPLDLIRYSTGSDSTLKFRDGRSSKVRFDWATNSERAAIGARLFPDAARFGFCVTDDDMASWLSNPNLTQALRPAMLQDQLEAAPVFQGNKFTANWVYECFLAAVVAQTAYAKCDLGEAIQSVCSSEARIDLQDIPQYLFQLDTQDYSGGGTGDARQSREQELQRDLRSQLGLPEVLATLRSTAGVLHQSLAEFESSNAWLRRVLANTICAALQQAVCNLLPNIDERSIRADFDDQESVNGSIIVWLSEAQTGGIGIVDQLQEMYSADPVHVLRSFQSSLLPADYEQVDADLFELLEELAQGESLADAAAAVRSAETFDNRVRANQELRRNLLDRGFRVSHTFSAVMHSRLLRPGSGPATDRRLLDRLRQWKGLEEILGLEIPMHIASFILAVEEVGRNDPVHVFAKACELQSTFWTRGAQVRQSALNYYNEFNTGLARTERLIGAAMWREECVSVLHGEAGWREDLHAALDSDGQVDLLVDRRSLDELGGIMASLHINPIDICGLEFYPRVESVTRNAGHLQFRLSLVEVAH